MSDFKNLSRVTYIAKKVCAYNQITLYYCKEMAFWRDVLVKNASAYS